jgi:hypothetical protein
MRPENYFSCTTFMTLLTLHRFLFVTGKYVCVFLVWLTAALRKGTVESKDTDSEFSSHLVLLTNELRGAWYS